MNNFHIKTGKEVKISKEEFISLYGKDHLLKLYYIYKGGLYYHSVYPKDESFLELVYMIPEMSSLEVDVDKHIPLGDFIDVYGYYSYEGIHLIHYCEDEELL